MQDATPGRGFEPRLLRPKRSVLPTTPSRNWSESTGGDRLFRPPNLRTYVRVKPPASIHAPGARNRDRRVGVVVRGAAAARLQDRRRKLAHHAEVRNALGDPVRPLRAIRAEPRWVEEALAKANIARGDPGRKLVIQSQAPEGASVRRRGQRAPLRALRSRRGVAREPDGANPRSHQRRPERQPARESPDRLSQLRGNLQDALRSKKSGAAEDLCPVWVPLLREATRATVLLPRVWDSLSPGAERRAPRGQTAAVRAAGGRDPSNGVPRDRSQVRHFRQRDPQVGEVLRERDRATPDDSGRSSR